MEWGSGILDESELAQFIQSYLVMLLACSSTLPPLSRAQEVHKGEQLLAFVTATAHSIARQIIRDTVTPLTKSGRKAVDFQSFGDWYNSGGFRTIPWLELIDLSKWTYLPSPHAKVYPSSDGERRRADSESDFDARPALTPIGSSGVRALEYSQYEDELEDGDDADEYDNDDDDDEEGLGKEPEPSAAVDSFHIMLYRDTGSSVISIMSNTAMNFLQYVTYSGLGRCPTETLWRAISESSVDGLIGRKAFISVMTRCISAFRPSASESLSRLVSSESSHYLGVMFSAFDRTNMDLADALELTVAASLFCSG